MLRNDRSEAGTGTSTAGGDGGSLDEDVVAALEQRRMGCASSRFVAGVGRDPRIFDGVPPTGFDIVSARHTPTSGI